MGARGRPQGNPRSMTSQTKPTPCALLQVPILRIFGTTPAGQSVCLHLHSVFPYFFIPYHSDLSTDPKFVAKYLWQLAMDIEHALLPPSAGLCPISTHVVVILPPAPHPFVQDTASPR